MHDSTTTIVSEQLAHLDTQLHSLDDIVSRIRAQNDTHHAAHVSSLASLSSNVETSYNSIDTHFSQSFSRIQDLDKEIQEQKIKALQNGLAQLGAEADIRSSLQTLRNDMQDSKLSEYEPTGDTPQRTAYDFPMTLPRTEDEDILIAKFKRGSPLKAASASDIEETARELSQSPSKPSIFADEADNVTMPLPSFSASMSQMRHHARPGTANSLRELDINVVNSEAVDRPAGLPPLKRQNTTGSSFSPKAASKLPLKKGGGNSRMTFAGDRENMTVPVNFSASVGPGSSVGTRRVLRSQGST